MRCADSSWFDAHASRRGVGLLEVLLALTLLGSVAAAGMTVRSRLVRATAAGHQRQVAVEAADALLTTWWLSAEAGRVVPRHGSGQVAGPDRLRWTTTTRKMVLTRGGLRPQASQANVGSAGGAQMDQVRLEMWPMDPVGGRQGGPVYAVDVLLPAVPGRVQ